MALGMSDLKKGLKIEVDGIADGGCLQNLEIRLQEIQQTINNFIILINETNKEEI